MGRKLGAAAGFDELCHTVPRELVGGKELAGSVRVGVPSGTVDSWILEKGRSDGCSR